MYKSSGSNNSTTHETRVIVPCGLASKPLKISFFFARWEAIERLCLSFLHAIRQIRFYTEA